MIKRDFELEVRKWDKPPLPLVHGIEAEGSLLQTWWKDPNNLGKHLGKGPGSRKRKRDNREEWKVVKRIRTEEIIELSD